MFKALQEEIGEIIEGHRRNRSESFIARSRAGELMRRMCRICWSGHFLVVSTA